MVKIVDDNGNEVLRKVAKDLGDNSYAFRHSIVSPVTAFGELDTAEKTPVIQLEAVYGLRTKTDIEIFKSGTGADATLSNGIGREFKVSSGTDNDGIARLRSKRSLRYRPGQGADARFTARFITPIADHIQGAGLIEAGNELTFRYQDEIFGVFHRTGGRLEIQTLTVTTPASGGETVTITLNGTAFNVSVTSGTTAQNAFEISEGTFAGYMASSNGSTVVFTAAEEVGDQTGTFSASSTGALVGSFVETKAGAPNVDTFIPQSDWSIDKMDGTGPSGMTLDPTKGNVYEIEFQYLGYGAIVFGIEDSESGSFQDVHMIKYANKNLFPSLLNPTFKIGWFSKSVGATTSVDVFGSSCFGSIQGKKIPLRDPDSHGNDKTVSTTLTNIISFRNRSVFSDIVNLNEVIPLFTSFSGEGTKPIVYTIYKNATLGGVPDWTYQDESDNIVEYDTAATTVTNVPGTTIELGNFSTGKSGQVSFNIGEIEIKLLRNEIITLAARATGGNADVTASLTWLED